MSLSIRPLSQVFWEHPMPHYLTECNLAHLPWWVLVFQWLVNITLRTESMSMHNDQLLKHPASSEEVNPPLIWKVHTSWNFSLWKRKGSGCPSSYCLQCFKSVLPGNFPKIKRVSANDRLLGVHVSSLSDTPSPAVERSNILFLRWDELPGWRKATGRAQGWGPLQWLLPLVN